jgi:hypothetical protein
MLRALELVELARASTNGKPHFDGRPRLTLPTELARAT